MREMPFNRGDYPALRRNIGEWYLVTPHCIAIHSGESGSSGPCS
jgi:hypothetical protein